MKIFLCHLILCFIGFEKPVYTCFQNKELVPGLFAFDDYEEGIENAKKAQKPVLLYFKDRRSANCIKFEKNIFSNNEIKNYLNKNFIVVCLLVDDNTVYTKSKKFKTKGEYNSHIEKSLFNSDAQPYSALLSEQNNFIKGFGYTSDQKEYLKFLKTSEK